MQALQIEGANSVSAVNKIRLGVALALCIGGIMSASADEKLHVSSSVTLDAAPEKVWDLIGNFVGLPAWHPAVASTAMVQGDNNVVGSMRQVVTKDGAKLLEKLQAYSAADHSMTYSIVDSPLPVTDYLSTLSVAKDGEKAVVTWESDFNRSRQAKDMDDQKVKDLVKGIYDSGLDGLKNQIEHTTK